MSTRIRDGGRLWVRVFRPLWSPGCGTRGNLALVHGHNLAGRGLRLWSTGRVAEDEGPPGGMRRKGWARQGEIGWGNFMEEGDNRASEEVDERDRRGGRAMVEEPTPRRADLIRPFKIWPGSTLWERTVFEGPTSPTTTIDYTTQNPPPGLLT
ncbi:hypothetical protein BT93_L1579 [Corymbia citriodora subsp. variegata]|uniref:Uncharacterized protein n=1 Tax=Corymbia citriodora subsp. variegata TaxID=360336 RepID=A0A8T0CM46_CORYI|nr:hypothetical protein BT93_L1579 [Corymbia citriodora subsp. variegata]